jgi:hypothetical protein
MGSPLDLVNSEAFRKKLITRNLVPYAKSPSKITPPINYEVIQSDLSVVDSPDQLIDEPTFANKLFPLNQYGTEGGYVQTPDPGALFNTKSNEGEYGFQDANIVDEGYAETKKWRPLNAYADTTQVFDAAIAIGSLDILQVNNGRGANAQPYPTFNSSFYSPISILLTNDPQGSDGLLSQDSFIARLGAATLRKEFEERIGREIKRNTIGRANIFNVASGTDVLNLITGIVPLIEPNYTITIPSNPLVGATDFALRLAGSIIPISTIPGSYFDASINSGQPTTIQQLSSAFIGKNANSGIGKFFGRLLGADKTGSQLFLNNTGGGQKSRLFGNIDYNRYKPGYDRTLFDRVAGVVVGSTTNNSNYYVGSITSEPSRVFSPSGDLPVNEFGQELQSPVYGPQELAQLYEGPSREVRLGANGPTYSNGGGIEGGMTWVSPKYKNNAGKVVGPGGKTGAESPNFKPSSYNSTESTENTFRGGSILDDTQRIIDSQPQGGRRLQHVGNAIDQVSKVFHDGYKELTKGSRVLTYVGAIGNEVGAEYCRVFAKDIPYLQYNSLQKTEGITTEGRRFSYSVLDKTYNLNIAPNKQEGGQDSSNIIGDMTSGYAKKYMFSLENLAWASSNTPGYSSADLAICERGPNGGRVMWFPPYGLTFTENVSANWKANDFIGRPEPIYTYNNTNRTGSLTWKIVVDHPSVLNLIVNKVLANQNNKSKIDSIIDSFFAGCRKYDLYELAKKYYTINPNDLRELQTAITSKEVTKEQMQYAVKTITTIPEVKQADPGPKINFDKYKNFGFYFDNDIPKSKETVVSFASYYSTYIGDKGVYSANSPTVTTPYASSPEQTEKFFSNVIENNFSGLTNMADEFVKFFTNDKNGILTVGLQGSASAPASVAYNEGLSTRRNNSVRKWFEEYNVILKNAINSSKLLFDTESLGENAQTTGSNGNGESYNCRSTVVHDSLQTADQKIYTVNAMACRRVIVGYVNVVSGPPSTPPVAATQQTSQDVLVGSVVPVTTTVPVETTNWVQKDNITKRVLRSLLSECDYFETIKQDTPMVYDNLKEKLKFFQPAFHSTTPEGLNTRLTFLQQCMRPGETIPTVVNGDGGKGPKLQYNNATNTAFGAPPVLILRVGDFYNTKIIPTSLALTYENLDINPEGIGIQPMIANVTLSFNFVGGSGLKTSIDKLQNALSFNYYANTEIYDDRSDVTDNSYKVLDTDFLKAIGQDTLPPTTNQVQNNNGQSNNNTVGTIISNIIVASGETGQISYSEFMDRFVKDTQNYFTNVVNKNKETVSQYNNAIRQQWMVERYYTQGGFSVNRNKIISLFGKPVGIESRVNKIFDGLIDDINNDTEGFINFISQPNKNFSTKLIRTVKSNYVNYVKNKKGSYQNAITGIIQGITDVQQSYLQTLARVNTISFPGIPNTGTDGFQQKNGDVKIYVTTGTTGVSTSSINVMNTLEELVNDIFKVESGITEFNEIIWSPNTFIYPGDNKSYTGTFVFETGKDGKTNIIDIEKVFIPFSNNVNFNNFSFRRVYMIVSDDVIDPKKYETFKSQLIGNVVNVPSIAGNISDVFDAYWNVISKPIFVEENSITKSFIDDMEKNKLKNFLNYTPFSTKKRIFSYTIENTSIDSRKASQKSLIKGLGAIGNQNTDINTWDNETIINSEAFISKVKLN